MGGTDMLSCHGSGNESGHSSRLPTCPPSHCHTAVHTYLGIQRLELALQVVHAVPEGGVDLGDHHQA